MKKIPLIHNKNPAISDAAYNGMSRKDDATIKTNTIYFAIFFILINVYR